ncbi:type 2 lanthipeptide synthetase LanM [Oceanivirga salmonicida]|nr:type 2 lanthipeptide synthetase LanM [Oceanivirga salmonicida]
MAVKEPIKPNLKNVYNSFIKNTNWYRSIEEILSSYDYSKSYDKELKYGNVFAPFIEYYSMKIADKLKSIEFISNDAIQYFCIYLANSLYNISIKTIIQELQYEKSEIKNKSDEEVLLIFLKKFQNKDYLENFYFKYPNLARKLFVECDKFFKFINNLLLDLVKDKKVLEKFILNNNKIEVFKFGEGDHHRGGKSVVELVMNTGESFYYKPTNLEIEKLFEKVIDLLNKSDKIIPMKTTESLYFKDHTYVKKIYYKSCEKLEEVSRCYIRFGQLLALSYIFNISDLHMENIIISGEYPIIVDGETFFCNRPPMNFNDIANAAKKNYDLINSFVTSSIILPSKLIINHDLETVDLGAISGTQQEIQGVLQLKDIDNARVRFEKAKGIIKGANNRVKFNGNIIDYREYIEDFMNGFDNCIQFILDNGNKFKKIFNDNYEYVTRILLRPTNNYAQFLNFILHPTCMENALNIDKILENLYAWPGINSEVFLSEYEDLLCGDIPYFSTSISKIYLKNSKDRVIVNNFFSSSSINKVYFNIDNQTNEMINIQKTIIKTKMGDYIRLKDTNEKFNNTTFSNFKINKECIIEEIMNIANSIISTATVDLEDESISWLSIDEERDFSPIPAQVDLHSGLAGIGLFFHYLDLEFNNKKYRNIANFCMKTIKKPVLSLSIGTSAFVGPFSGLYFALKLLEFNPRNKDITEYIRECYISIKYFIKSEKYDDISWLTGVSSLVCILLDYYSVVKDEDILNTCIELGNKINSIYINKNIEDSGIAHGKLGIGVAFAKLGKITGLEEFLLLSEKIYVDEFKKYKIGDNEIRSWCRGKAGLVSSILYDYNKNNYNFYKNISKKYINNIKLMRSDCLCHGNSSEIDSLINIYNVLNDEEFLNYGLYVARQMIDRKINNGKYSIERFEGFPPISMFKSELGVAYTLLRLLNPKIPSIPMLM